jgi:hypothetical protein
MQASYFTRLTPNSNQCQNTSGPSGNCTASTGLYESRNGFGWEERLREDFHSGENLCYGFLQAINGENKSKAQAEVINLYTRVCNGVNTNRCYVGFIKDEKL